LGQEGYLTLVQPLRQGNVVDHGEVYLRVIVEDAAGQEVGVVWAGYYGNAFNPASIPNLRVFPGDRVFAFLANGSRVQITVNVLCRVESEPSPAGTFIFWEAPGTGPGVRRTVSLGDPVAGANYATVTVPAQVVWKIRAFYGSLQCDATVANRYPFQQWRNATPSVISEPGGVQAQVAGQLMTWSAGKEFANTGVGAVRAWFPIDSELPLGPGYSIVFGTTNLTAGDNWGPGFLEIEEWTLP